MARRLRLHGGSNSAAGGQYFFFNPDNVQVAELPHPYTSDDEHELLTSFRAIKQPQNKRTVISVSRMAA
jgi:hypothetical protein